jgi:hypothetical protein
MFKRNQNLMNRQERKAINKGLMSDAWNFLKQNKDLFWYPVINLLIAIPIMLVIVAGFLTFGTQPYFWVSYLLAGGMYLLFLFLAILTNASMVFSIMQRLENKPCSMADAYTAMIKRWPALLGWVAISATIGALLHALERHTVLQLIARFIVGIVWGSCTYLVMPILVSNNVGPITAIKESVKLVGKNKRKVFGAFGKVVGLSLLAVLAIGAFMLVALPFLFGAGIAIMVLAFLAIMLLSACFTGVVQSALYLRLHDNKAISAFNNDQLNAAFQ